MCCELVFERAVAVGSFPEIVSIDPDLAVPIHTVELNEDQPSITALRNRKSLPIPSSAPGQCATAMAGGMLFTEFAFDTPVMRKIELAPRRIIQSNVLSVRNISQVKAPLLVARHSHC